MATRESVIITTTPTFKPFLPHLYHFESLLGFQLASINFKFKCKLPLLLPISRQNHHLNSSTQSFSFLSLYPSSHELSCCCCTQTVSKNHPRPANTYQTQPISLQPVHTQTQLQLPSPIPSSSPIHFPITTVPIQLNLQFHHHQSSSPTTIHHSNLQFLNHSKPNQQPSPCASIPTNSKAKPPLQSTTSNTSTTVLTMAVPKPNQPPTCKTATNQPRVTQAAITAANNQKPSPRLHRIHGRTTLSCKKERRQKKNHEMKLRKETRRKRRRQR